MEITTTNPENQAPKLPNPANTLTHVLWAISHMIENNQITRSAPALCNVLEEIEGYTSDHMCTLRQVILGHLVDYHTAACVPLGLIEPVALWEDEDVYYGMDGSPMDNTPPFGDDYQRRMLEAADKAFGAPEPEPQEEIYEVVLWESERQLVFKALDAYIAAKGDNMTEEEERTLNKVIEALA